MNVHVCARPSCFPVLFQNVKEHRQSISTVQSYGHLKTKTPYAVGTRRGYGLGYLLDCQPKIFLSFSWNASDFFWSSAVL